MADRRTEQTDDYRDVLDPFEGQPVIASAVALRKTGDGLSKALEMEPQQFELGEVIGFVGLAVVRKVGYKTVVTAEDCLSRVHDADATEVMFIPSADADELLGDFRRKVAEWADAKQRELEEAEGIQRIVPAVEAD